MSVESRSRQGGDGGRPAASSPLSIWPSGQITKHGGLKIIHPLAEQLVGLLDGLWGGGWEGHRIMELETFESGRQPVGWEDCVLSERRINGVPELKTIIWH
jgi:hypothetical protein